MKKLCVNFAGYVVPLALGCGLFVLCMNLFSRSINAPPALWFFLKILYVSIPLFVLAVVSRAARDFFRAAEKHIARY
ncbi:MAG: hypothetical protein LBT68_04270 [Spirochaetales bacterium]|jgi:hypothetical protein|nr:hypothetical protein [Spirochaetales bacterium]